MVRWITDGPFSKTTSRSRYKRKRGHQRLPVMSSIALVVLKGNR
jgi:hypothetical protein